MTTTAAIAPESPAILWRRAAVLFIVLALGIVASTWMVRSQHRSVRVADIARQAVPATIIEKNRVWSSVDFNLTEVEMSVLETRDYLARTYTDGAGRPVDLAIVFSEDNRKGTHPPDVCLQGAGSVIEQRADRTLDLPSGEKLPIREVISRTGAGQRTYFAWFYKSGDSFTASFYRQQASIIWNGLLGRNTSGALIRYAVPIDAESGVDAARKRVDDLITVTFPHIRDKLNGEGRHADTEAR